MITMVYGLQRALLLTGAMVAFSGSLTAEPVRWFYEGLITRADPKLAPDLQSGWVLAGSFLFDALELEEAIPMDELRSGRLEGGISEGELTVDLYYQVRFEASQTTDYAGFDYQENDPDEDGRDLIGWFIPLSGPLDESGWRSTWLQVWLSDSGGEMLRRAPPAVPPSGFAWKSAWFRLTFVKDSGEEASAEGRMDIFSPESEVDQGDPEAELSRIVTDLANRLVERDSVIDDLRGDLAAMQDRVTGLRAMVDLLVEERSHLQAETARLEEQLELVDPDAQEQLASITAEKALLEQQITEADDQNATLAARLGQSEARRRDLMDRISELETAATLPPPETTFPEPEISMSPDSGEEPKKKKTTELTSPSGLERAEPVIINRPSPAAPPPEAEPESPPTRRFGPRKFR